MHQKMLRPLILEYPGLTKMYDQACKNPTGHFSSLRSAIDHCKNTRYCAIVDPGCDDIDTFQYCNMEGLEDDLIVSSESCVYSNAGIHMSLFARL